MMLTIPRGLLETLVSRLERVPVDSYWAHRASGVRGSLLLALDAEEHGRPGDPSTLYELTRQALLILRNAAGERILPGAGGTRKRTERRPRQ